jgi:hypothetical protein
MTSKNPMEVVDPHYVSAIILTLTVLIDGEHHTLTLPSYGNGRKVAEALRDGNFIVTLRTTQVVEELIHATL